MSDFVPIQDAPYPMDLPKLGHAVIINNIREWDARI